MNREINRDMLVALIKEQEPSFLQAARRTGYVCPVCGNGTGADGDGLAKDKDKPLPKWEEEAINRAFDDDHRGIGLTD